MVSAMARMPAIAAEVADRLRDELGGVTGDLRQEYGRIALEKSETQRTEYDFYALGHLALSQSLSLLMEARHTRGGLFCAHTSKSRKTN